MNPNRKIGISHILAPGTPIIHSTVLGKSCLGRISDLVLSWCEHQEQAKSLPFTELRVMIQALLDFSTPRVIGIIGNFEAGFSDNSLVVASRFESPTPLTVETAERELTQFWLNSEEVKILKRVLDPLDRVEVRYHQKLNLVEWRVYRPIHAALQEETGASFVILLDESPDISTGAASFIDLGDLEFQDWLKEVYRSRGSAGRAGEVLVAEGETQDEAEWSRIVVEKEIEEIDSEVSKSFSGDEQTQEAETRFESGHSEVDESSIVVGGTNSEAQELKEKLKRANLQLRQLELKVVQASESSEQKVRKLEVLLKKKEVVGQKFRHEIELLNQKLTEAQTNSNQQEKIEHFRTKALEMFEKLKKVKEEKDSLEKVVVSYKEKDLSAPKAGFEGINPLQKDLEEAQKKLERTLRALEAEKVKVKSLSERVIVAEKEAQSASPLIEDLESKVEHTLKVAQQHKKDTEVVKQKLVQSEAEKNKIKNELVKAQAQIQTLMKRQAS